MSEKCSNETLESVVNALKIKRMVMNEEILLEYMNENENVDS